jgi:hypothetical protein
MSHALNEWNCYLQGVCGGLFENQCGRHDLLRNKQHHIIHRPWNMDVAPIRSCLYLSSEQRYGPIQFVVAQMAAIFNLDERHDLLRNKQLHMIHWHWSMDIATKIMSLSLLCEEIRTFVIAQMAAILNLEMTDMTYIEIINFIWFTDPENLGIATKIMSLSLLWAEIWTFVIAQMAAILNLEMTDMTYIEIINFIWFTDHENLGIATNIMSLSVLWAEIWTYSVCGSTNGGHFEFKYDRQFQLIHWSWKHGISYKFMSLSLFWAEI